MSDHSTTAHLTRRALTLGLTGLAGMAVTSRVAWAQPVVPTPVVTGDCALEPGVQLLIDWRLGKPVMTMAELLPPLDWVIYRHPTMPLIFRYPSDWTPYALWAGAFTETGAPIWSDVQPLIPQLTLARIVSPAGDAAFEFAGGIVQGMPMTPAQVAVVAKQGILGDNPRLQSICTYEDSNLLAPTWFEADHADTSVLVTSGTAIPLPSSFMPATNVVYQNLVGPQEGFEEVMRTTFLPILMQFIGGGEDDDDDDDDDDDGDDDDS